MKKIISILVVLAMLMAMAPAVFAAEGTWSDPVDLGSETGDFTFESTGEWGNGYYIWTAPADGTVTLTMTSDNWQYTICYEDRSSEISHDCTDDVVVASSSLDVYEGDVVSIWVNGGHDVATFKPAVCTVEFNVSFTEGEVLKATDLHYMSLYYEGAQTATVPANGMIKYNLNNFASYEGIFQVTGGASIRYGETVYEPDADTNTASCAVTENIAVVYVENNTDVDMEVILSVYIPEGDVFNPAALQMGSNPVIELRAYGYYYFKWTAEESGTLTLKMEDETVLWNYSYAVFSVEDGMYLGDGYSDGFDFENSILEVTVEAGNYVEISLCNYNAAATTFILNASFTPAPESGDGDEGGEDNGDAVPNGGALSLGNNNVTLNIAGMPMMAANWTYTATENGYVTITVTSIDGNAMLDRAFGMGWYALYVGNNDNNWTNTVKVYLNAEETIRVALVDTVSTADGTPAVINVAFEAGEPTPERNPGDYFDGSGTEDDPYIIDTLAEPVDIFVSASGDIRYQYTAESDGTLNIVASVEGYAATNCWVKVNDGNYSGVLPVTVSEGDVVMINIWQGYEGTVSLAVDEGGDDNTGDDNTGDDNTGDDNTGDASLVEDGTATAEQDSKYTIFYTPEQNGTLTVTVGDGTAAWVSDVMDCSDFSVIPGASGTEEGTYTIEVTAGTTYYVRIYGAGDPCAAITDIPYSITFTPASDDGDDTPVLDDYKVADDKITEEGTHDITVAVDEAETTLYTFAPSATGVYTIELISGDVDMSLWSTIMYNKTMDATDGVLTITCTAVGQNWFIGFAGDAAAQIKVTKTGEYEDTPKYETIIYENKQEPIDFDDTLYEITGSVNVTDSVIDTAVLGEDGYYHLNTADGPILYVDFFGVEPSIGAAWGYGNVSYGAYEDGKLVSVTDYQDALGEYLMAENTDGNYTYGNNYHPLTADLIEMLKNIGANNGWYGEDGYVGDSEDAWMFSCVTMKLIDNDTGDDPTTGDDSAPEGPSQTGDNTVLGVAIAAAVISAMSVVALPVVKKHF